MLILKAASPHAQQPPPVPAARSLPQDPEAYEFASGGILKTLEALEDGWVSKQTSAELGCAPWLGTHQLDVVALLDDAASMKSKSSEQHFTRIYGLAVKVVRGNH